MEQRKQVPPAYSAMIEEVMRAALLPGAIYFTSGDDPGRERWWWKAEPGLEGARTVRITQEVVDDVSLSWDLIRDALWQQASQWFSDPQGCTLIVKREPEARGGFVILHGATDDPEAT